MGLNKKIKIGKTKKSLIEIKHAQINSEFSKILNSKPNDLEITFAEALVNPEYVKYLSTILGREVKQEKADTRDYNNAFIRRLDIQAIELMEGGLKDDVLPGEAMKIKAFGDLDKGNDDLIQRLKKAIETKSYNSFPFSKEISDDIRVKFLLRTESTDSFDSLIEDISKNKKDIISDEDWSVLTSSMKESEKRLSLERVIFLSPLDEGITGTLKRLSNSEANNYTLNVVNFDLRSDSHDLVALKELSLAINGASVDQLSPFAGAFSKCLPELNKKGVRGVVFEVEDNKLKSVKLSTLKGMELVPFGPMEAGLALADVSALEKLSQQNKRFYVCVPGYVAAPETSTYGFTEKFPLNKNVVPSAETFLFANSEGAVLSTRIYFYAHKPSQLNPVFQTMSVIYGDSDQMFNSCANDPKNEFFTNEVKEEFFERIRFYGYDDEPAVKAAKLHYMDRDLSPERLVSDETPQYLEYGIKASDSLYGENKFTVEKYLKIAQKNSKFPNDLAQKVSDSNCLNLYHPLSARFIVFNYLDGKNGGMSKEANITSLAQIPRYNFHQIMQDFLLDHKMNQLMNKAVQVRKEKNITIEAAMDEVMTPEEQKEALRRIGREKK